MTLVPYLTARASRVAAVAILCSAASASGIATAAELSADDIAAAIEDRTYQGSMTRDAFAEYYAADGSVRGDGYTGRWRTEDGSLCLSYGGGEEQCWGVSIRGPSMTLLKDGEVDGSGMLVDGNPLGL